MPTHTPNHAFAQYADDELPWTLTDAHADDFATLDARLPVRDAEAARDAYEPHAGARFVATDSGAVYDGDGEAWTPAARSFETVGVTTLDATDATVGTLTVADAATLGGEDVATQAWVNDNSTTYTDSDATSAVGGSTPWANSDLSNDTVTVAGNSVSLGDSTTVAHADLSDAPAAAHHEVFEPADYTPESDVHDKYTDSEAVSAVNSESSLSVDISGEADTVDGYHASSFPVMGVDETITGAWTFEDTVQISTGSTGTALDLNAGDILGVDDLRFGSSGGPNIYAGGSIAVDLSSAPDVNIPNGLSVSGDPVVTSSSDYEIQKNGSDTNGVINFKTN